MLGISDGSLLQKMQSRMPGWQRALAIVLFLHVGYLYFLLLRPPLHFSKIYLSSDDKQSTKHLPPYSDSTNGTVHSDKLPKLSSKFRRVNSIVTEYDEDVARRLRELIARKATSRDLDLISLIRELMDPPSHHILKTVRQVTETPQSKEADTLLGRKKGGFYIECGALDGERSSNTIFFEKHRGWSGLLIEMDPYFYTQLMGKSRRAYSINACLSPYDYPIEMEFKESSGGSGQLIDPSGKGGAAEDGLHTGKAVIRKVPCFPLESMLMALNQTQVDYFSLDVEGFELDVLRTIPFDRLDIGVLSVEYAHGRAGKTQYKEFMENHGYITSKDIHYHEYNIAMFVDDYIFIKRSWEKKFKSNT